MPMFESELYHRPIQGLRCNGFLKRKRITTIWKTFHSSGLGIELTYPTLHIAILVKHTDIELSYYLSSYFTRFRRGLSISISAAFWGVCQVYTDFRGVGTNKNKFVLVHLVVNQRLEVKQ
jgi:hypothetical protein